MNSAEHAPAAVHTERPNNSPHVLYVSENNSNVVEVLKYGTWTSLGTITNGVGLPQGLWVDKNQSLYVANDPCDPCANVTEYNSARDLIFTYSNNGASMLGVTTDSSGNVYVAGDTGITEFRQLSNSPVKTCPSTDGGYRGVAVDTHGDVFVTLFNATGSIIEYPHGLRASHCNGSVLPIAINAPTGMAVDKQNNLVVCEGDSPYVIDIIAPPYTNVTRTLGSGFVAPLDVTIDSAGTTAYVGSFGGVAVVTYPGGSILATITGVVNAAVDSHNYVP